MQEITLTRKQINEMDPAEFESLVLKATEIKATAVVRRADGSIKYDDPTQEGSFFEENLGE